MARIKMGSPEASAIMQNLKTCEVGEEIVLPGLFPGLPSKTQALCLDRQGDKFWQFSLTCLGVMFASVVAEVHGNELVLEEV